MSSKSQLKDRDKSQKEIIRELKAAITRKNRLIDNQGRIISVLRSELIPLKEMVYGPWWLKLYRIFIKRG